MPKREYRRMMRADAGRPITLRRAAWSDREWVLALRNAPDILRAGRGVKATPKWWHGVESFLWIIERGVEPIGYLIDAPAFVVSIALDGQQRGKGYGTAALKKFLREHTHAEDTTLAWVHKDNRASLRAFKKAGFREDERRHRSLLLVAAR